MNDAEFDLYLQELKADGDFRRQTAQKQRETVWRKSEEYFKALPGWKDWKSCAPEKLERRKQQLFDIWFPDDDQTEC